MKKVFLSLLFLLVAQIGLAQDAALKADVLKVIAASGADGQMKSAKSQILKMIPEAKQAAFILEFDATLPSLYDKMAQVYIETYTKEDIKAMLVFYDSPVGKKMTAKAGEVVEKSQEAGKAWGEALQAIMVKYME